MCTQGRIRKKSIHAPYFLNEPIEYGKSFSRGMSVNLGTAMLLFISGTASIDKNGKTVHRSNFLKQVERTYRNIAALLKSEGADWHDIVKTVCYLKDMKYYKAFNDYRNLFHREQKINPPPASVCIQTILCRPDLLIEMEATAVIKKR